MTLARLAAMLFIAATLAQAAPMVDAQGNYHANAPDRYEGQGVAGATTPQWLIANAGWRLATSAEIAAQAIADQEAAQLAADLASLPAVFKNGIAVLDGDGHHIELVPTGNGLPVIGAQVSHSPLTKDERAMLKQAVVAAVVSRKATAEKAKTDKEKISVTMKTLYGIEEPK